MPFFFRYYKNSFLASVFSILGCVSFYIAIAFGYYSFFQEKEEATTENILILVGFIAAGFILSIAGSAISKNKAQKKLAALKQDADQSNADKQTIQMPYEAAEIETAPVAEPEKKKWEDTPEPSASPKAQSFSEEEALNALKSEALKYHEQKNFQEEISVLQNACQIAPRNGEIRFLLGRAYKAAGQFDKAAGNFQKAISFQPNEGIYYCNLASLYLNRNPKQSIPLYEKGLSLLPSFDKALPGCLADYALALGRTGQKEKALQILNDAEKRGFAHGDVIRKQIQ